MDNKTLVAKIAQQMGIDTKTATTLMNGFVEILGQRAADLDSIALPGFGNFVSMKVNEHIDTDPATGVRRLIPPRVKVEFIASSMLKKRLENE